MMQKRVDRTILVRGKSPAVSSMGSALRRFVKRQPLGAAGGVVCGVIILIAITAPWIIPHDPNLIDQQVRLRAPGGEYLLGTDHLGRDVLSRVLLGARISVTVAFLAVGLGQVIGSSIGIGGAYYGKWADLALQRFSDMLIAFPTLILALALVMVLDPSIRTVIVAIAVIYSVVIGRVVRSVALSVKEMDYVLAARAVGASGRRIMFRHILPQCLATIFVLASIEIPGAIIVESSLSFLGLGVPPPTPTWGSMLASEGRRFIEVAPWVALAPGIAISLTVLGFNLFGDALRDTLDPRLRGS